MASIYSVLIQTWRVYNVRNQTWTVLIVSRAKHRLLIVLRAKHGVVYLYFSVPNMECVCCYEPNMSTIYSVTSQTCHLFIKSQTCLFKVLRTKRWGYLFWHIVSLGVKVDSVSYLASQPLVYRKYTAVCQRLPQSDSLKIWPEQMLANSGGVCVGRHPCMGN
jgi:hypothetical protein